MIKTIISKNVMIVINPSNRKYTVFKTKNKKNYNHIPMRYIGKFKIKLDKDGEYFLDISDDLLKEIENDNIILKKKDKKLSTILMNKKISYEVRSMCIECFRGKSITTCNDENSYKYYNNRLCFACSNFIIKEKLIETRQDTSLFKHFRQYLRDGHSFEDVEALIDNKFDFIENSQLTLHSTIDASSEDKKTLRINDLQLPRIFASMLSSRIDYLRPVQELAIKEGLLDGENLLIVSPTASGKTLIGELAGIPRVFDGYKMIYLTPLVALANQKYHDFKKFYGDLNLNIVIKVGKNRINADEELTINDESVDDADIIIATYEGLDSILRKGEYYRLNPVGCVVIDEIQLLGDVERGSRLYALIKRLKVLFKEAQLLALSATIKNSEKLASKFNLKLIEYNKRPIKIEKHLMCVNSREEKNIDIAKLCECESNQKSSKGYYGQTIIFTNARRKTEILSDYLNNRGIKTEAYHSGLSYAKKIEIEEKFTKQEISTVVTTSALAMGVDFPASLVIFDSLMMGIKKISINEFHQMIGRAGRPSFHDSGKVYLLPEIGMFYCNNESKDALELLESKITDVKINLNYENVLDYLLSDICSFNEVSDENLKNSICEDISVKEYGECIKKLFNNGLIEFGESRDVFVPTKYGRAVSVSFLSVDEADYIRHNLEGNPLDLAITLEQLNIYVSNKLLNKLPYYQNSSNNLFSESMLSLIYQNYDIDFTDKSTREKINKLINDTMTCNCMDFPYCPCLRKNLEEKVMDLRLEKKSPHQISTILEEKYLLKIYGGDIFNWLDRIVYKLESIQRISNAFNNNEKSKECQEYIDLIIG